MIFPEYNDLEAILFLILLPFVIYFSWKVLKAKPCKKLTDVEFLKSLNYHELKFLNAVNNSKDIEYLFKKKQQEMQEKKE